MYLEQGEGEEGKKEGARSFWRNRPLEEKGGGGGVMVLLRTALQVLEVTTCKPLEGR